MTSVALLAVTVVAVIYLGYRAALPRPLPGIPYNKDAASKLFGDVPEMMRYVLRTKRIFVGLPTLPCPSQILRPFTHMTSIPVLAHINDNKASQPHRASLHQANGPPMGHRHRPRRESGYPASADQRV